MLKVTANERFAARNPDLAHADLGEDFGHTSDLLKGQQFFSGHEGIARPEYLAGHTVDTAKIAAVGHRNPKIPQRAVQPVKYGFAS